MSPSRDEKAQLDAIIAQYRAGLERLNYVIDINVYLRSVRRLLALMEEHGLELSDLTPDIATDRGSYRQALRRVSVGAGDGEAARAADAGGDDLAPPCAAI